MTAPARPITVLSNIAGLERVARERGVSMIAAADRPVAFLGQLRLADLVVIDNDWNLLALACLARPLHRFRLVSVDLILRRPKTRAARLARPLKRRLLSAVDRFLLYFRDTAGYEALYGVGGRRAAYVPFKVNGIEDPALWPSVEGEGEHVLLAGRTLRDVDGFVAAMAETGLPGVLLQQRRDLVEAHGTRAVDGALPPNLRIEIDPGDDVGAFIAAIARARVVVIPRFRGDMAATGISTYLTAMALGRPVVISAGPGAEDVLDGEAVIVPPEDRAALAAAITRVWHDGALRSDLVARGKAYARAIGGEDRLFRDILSASLELVADQRAAGDPIPASR